MAAPRHRRSTWLRFVAAGSACALTVGACTIEVPCEETLTCTYGVASTGRSLDAGTDADAGTGGGTSTGRPGPPGFGVGSGVDASVLDGADCDEECTSDRCCNGECVDLASSLEHCGRCGNECSGANATSTCNGGTCELVECTDDFLDCNGDAHDGCEVALGDAPDTPTLIGPAYGHTTGSFRARSGGTLKPRFSWSTTQSGACDVSYEIQVDGSCLPDAFEECEFRSPEIRKVTADTELVPGNDLPVETLTAPVGSRYYWRVRACDERQRCSAWSEVRYLDVGRLPDDVNGDGYSDAVVTTTSGSVRVLPGRSSFGSAPPSSVDTGVAITSPGVRDLRLLGDVDGDGFGDVGVGGVLETGLPEAPRVIFGGPSLAQPRTAQLDPMFADDELDDTYPTQVAPLGDRDGDGYADFAVLAAPDVTRLYYGHPAIDDMSQPDATLDHATDRAVYGGVVGDMDGDGRADSAFGVGSAALLVLRGSAAREMQVVALSPGADCPSFAAALPWEIHGGDLDGDALADFVRYCVGPNASASQMTLHLGGSPLGDARVDTSFDLVHQAHLLDMNSDGTLDLFVQDQPASAFVFVGGSALPSDVRRADDDAGAGGPTEAFVVDPAQGTLRFVSGDYDGDGFEDLLVLTPAGGLFQAPGTGQLVLPALTPVIASDVASVAYLR